MKNRGTKEGVVEERQFVIDFNSGKYFNFTNKFLKNKTDIYCVHVTSQKYSNTSDQKVQPKSDVFLIKSNNEIKHLLLTNNNYLNEQIIQGINFEIIPKSGISIKMFDSKKYQIHKFTPASFIKVFNNKFLGCGAMIYCSKEDEVIYNEIIFKHWGVNQESFINYFSNALNQHQDINKLDSLEKIKTFCNKEIKNLIKNNSKYKKIVFTGEGVFDDPFYATYSFIDKKLDLYKFTDFTVTTGSSRKNNPTIVIKPK